MRIIDADLFKSNVKAWAENIRDFRSDNKCFFTEENVLKAIDDQPTVELEEDIKKLIGYWFSALEDEGCEPWKNEECINMARKYGYTSEDYKKYLSTIV